MWTCDVTRFKNPIIHIFLLPADLLPNPKLPLSKKNKPKNLLISIFRNSQKNKMGEGVGWVYTIFNFHDDLSGSGSWQILGPEYP